MAPPGDAARRAPPDTARMHIVHHAHLSADQQEGTRRLVAADHHQGIGQFQVWLVTLAPGAATADQRHDGELVAIALQGSGKLLVDGGPQRFQAPCTLVVPRGAAFHVANNGSTTLELVTVFTRAPTAADAARA
jgi:quercetin dioxygenase-like cupin family protein